MGIWRGTARPGRDQTDESLLRERENADRVLAEAQVSIARDADAVVARARATADALLREERARADDRLLHTEPLARAAVAAERALADEVVHRERASADDRLRRERAEYTRALATLRPLERDETNRYLVTERACSDDSLSHRDEFLGIVTHDLRDLLGAIVHGAELLCDDAADTEEGQQVVLGARRIQRHVARMNTLIGDLVDVASIEAGKLSMAPARSDAVALVTEAVETYRLIAAERKVSLEAHLVEPPLSATFDHGRILQVLRNLLANALKFTAPGGVVRVRAERVGDDLRLCVSDTGQGIPGHLLEAVFQRFQQVSKNDRRGHGLGLYISRHIVEGHGGRIWAESELGEGSQLYLTLPGAGTLRGHPRPSAPEGAPRTS
jgi:signal transduction histidine kinase